LEREKPVFGRMLKKILSRDDDDIINNEQKFCNIREEDFTSLFSLSLSLF